MHAVEYVKFERWRRNCFDIIRLLLLFGFVIALRCSLIARTMNDEVPPHTSSICDDEIDVMFDTFCESCQFIESQLEEEQPDCDNNQGDMDEDKIDGAQDADLFSDTSNSNRQYQNEFEQQLASNGIGPNTRIANENSTTIDTDVEAMDLNSQTDPENCLDVFVSVSAIIDHSKQGNSALPTNLFNTNGYVRITKVGSDATKTNINTPASKRPKQFNTGPSPLLIRDILRISIEKNSFLNSERELYGRRFRRVMFYGRCEPVNTRSSKYNGQSSAERIDTNKRIYKVDDGSASIVVHFSHASKIYQDLQRGVHQLSAEYEDACRSGIPYLGGDYPPTTKRCKEMLGHLKKIISIIKRNASIRQDFFDSGSKVCVIGTPFLNSSNNTVQIIAFNILEDNQINREFEVNFKQTLFDFYDQKYLK